MSYFDDRLREREYKTVGMPLPAYCSISTCQVLIHVGEPVKRYDGATFTHIVCPKTPLKAAAPHKYTDTGLRFGNRD